MTHFNTCKPLHGSCYRPPNHEGQHAQYYCYHGYKTEGRKLDLICGCNTFNYKFHWVYNILEQESKTLENPLFKEAELYQDRSKNIFRGWSKVVSELYRSYKPNEYRTFENFCGECKTVLEVIALFDKVISGTLFENVSIAKLAQLDRLAYDAMIILGNLEEEKNEEY